VIDGDWWGIFKDADVATGDVAPTGVDLFVEPLQLDDGRSMTLQYSTGFVKNVYIALVPAPTRHLNLQLGNFFGTDTGVGAVVKDGGLDLVEALLEAAGSADPDLLARRVLGPVVVHLVVDLTKNVVICYGEDLVAEVAVHVDILVEEESHAALAVLLLLLCRGNGHSKHSCEMATDMGSGVSSADG